MNIWEEAQQVNLNVSKSVKPGFDCWFDERVPLSTKREINSFLKWVQANYSIPVKLQVDFCYNHFLLQRNHKHAYYLFHYESINEYPNFNKQDKLPIIYLPVRTEHCNIEDIIYSFVRAITWYYAWICHKPLDDYEISDADVEEVFLKYLDYKQSSRKKKS